jgi:hypothetical protein
VNPGADFTIIRFTVPGSYLFQLMVTDDNGATGVDTVSVLVSGSKIEGNKIPVANAVHNKIITLPDSAVVTGTGTDVDGKVVAYLWSQVSGPARSTIRIRLSFYCHSIQCSGQLYISVTGCR